jgi:23S rRNA pseudouridine2605 synthase
MTEKIQKILAHAGLGSRRQIEQLIQSDRIVVNGKLAKLGDRITYQDQVIIDGREIKLIKSQQQKPRVLLYYKPEGEMCTRSDPEGRPTVFDNLPYIRHNRWISIGRLDFNTSGLLLFTNNGELANQLMHPSAQIEREYAVRIRGEVSDQTLTRLKKGVKLEDGIANFQQIIPAGGSNSNYWYHVIVTEGRNRVVRRLWESQGLTVSRLMRIRFGAIALPKGLNRGRYIELEEDEIEELMNN